MTPTPQPLPQPDFQLIAESLQELGEQAAPVLRALAALASSLATLGPAPVPRGAAHPPPGPMRGPTASVDAAGLASIAGKLEALTAAINAQRDEQEEKFQATQQTLQKMAASVSAFDKRVAKLEQSEEWLPYRIHNGSSRNGTHLRYPPDVYTCVVPLTTGHLEHMSGDELDNAARELGIAGYSSGGTLPEKRAAVGAYIGIFVSEM